MRLTKEAILAAIKGTVIVSCQALPGEPLYVEGSSIMYLMARAAKQAGAVCIRTSGIEDVKAIKEETGLPVIGLVKRQYEGYDAYITPTMKEIDDLWAARSDVIALDCTFGKRGDGTTINEFLKQIREKYPEIILMADISTYEEGINAWKCGVDLVGTTMSGYTPDTLQISGPDYKLVEALSRDLTVPVIGEGRIHTPEQARQMLQAGAYAVVVGGAITRPLEIARRFIEGIG